MKILKKGFTNNDFSIQLEDWSEDLLPGQFNFTIGAYPKGTWNKRFRCQCDFENKSEAEKAFEELLNNFKTVFDFDFTVMVRGGNRISIKETNLKQLY